MTSYLFCGLANPFSQMYSLPASVEGIEQYGTCIKLNYWSQVCREASPSWTKHLWTTISLEQTHVYNVTPDTPHPTIQAINTLKTNILSAISKRLHTSYDKWSRAMPNGRSRAMPDRRSMVVSTISYVCWYNKACFSQVATWPCMWTWLLWFASDLCNCRSAQRGISPCLVINSSRVDRRINAQGDR